MSLFADECDVMFGFPLIDMRDGSDAEDERCLSLPRSGVIASLASRFSSQILRSRLPSLQFFARLPHAFGNDDGPGSLIMSRASFNRVRDQGVTLQALRLCSSWILNPMICKLHPASIGLSVL